MHDQKIGFIGLGVMGKSIASHLLTAGYNVAVYNRTKSKADELIAAGASWIDSPKAIAENSNIIFTMVGYPEDVKEVYLGENGLLKYAKQGSYLIDLTTSTPTLAMNLFTEGEKRKLFVLDAPVTGGDIGAQNGTLTMMVGGDKAIFEKLRSILAVFCKTIVYQGAAGAGQHAKMCNQIAIASNMIGVAEAIVYAKNAGLAPEKVLDAISAGAAGSWSLSHLAPRMLQNDYSPGFFIKHFIKDMGIALEEAERMNLKLPGLQLAKQLYDTLAEKGEENSGTQAIIKYWNK